MTIHPDDPDHGMFDPTDKQYLERLKMYQKDYGNTVFEMYCSRPELLEELR